MFTDDSNPPRDSPAGAPWPEFEDRILAAIEKAESAGELPLLSPNAKRILFLQLQMLREELGFIDGLQRGWPDLPEKREQAARSRIMRGFDLFTGRPILNDEDYRAVVVGQKNAVETIDLIGRVETAKLLAETFQMIVEVYFTAWREMPDLRWAKFRACIEIFRTVIIAECRVEWGDRRLAERENEPGTRPEFEGLPPVWFDHLPLTDVARLEVTAAVWSDRARECEFKRRAEIAPQLIPPESAAAPPAPEFTEIPATKTAPEVIAEAVGQAEPPQPIPPSRDTVLTIKSASPPTIPDEWLRAQMDALDIRSLYELHELGGPSQHTAQRILNKLPVRGSTWRKVVKALNKARVKKGHNPFEVKAVSELLGIPIL